MSDRLDHHRVNDEATLAAALRALPHVPPPCNAWPRLSARIQRRRRARRVACITVPAALAAGVALAFVGPQLATRARSLRPSVPRTAMAAPAARSPDVASLQTRSVRLQAWVATLDREGPPLNSEALATAVTLQDRIGLIDLQLSAARHRGTSASLWLQRIDLLQRLGMLHLRPYTVAREAPATHPIITL